MGHNLEVPAKIEDSCSAVDTKLREEELKRKTILVRVEKNLKRIQHIRTKDTRTLRLKRNVVGQHFSDVMNTDRKYVPNFIREGELRPKRYVIK